MATFRSISQPGRFGAQSQQVHQPERFELGDLGAQHLMQDPAFGGQRSTHGPGGELGGGNVGAQQHPGDRAGRRPHDDLGRPGVPPAVVLERGEHAGVVGLADDASGPQDESDAAHGTETVPRTTSGNRVSRPAFLARRVHVGHVTGRVGPLSRPCPGRPDSGPVCPATRAVRPYPWRHCERTLEVEHHPQSRLCRSASNDPFGGPRCGTRSLDRHLPSWRPPRSLWRWQPAAGRAARPAHRGPRRAGPPPTWRPP